ncbi:MOSC domain-containing protein [Iodobacter fluviatilis]|uniref:MOSC domain-containing protein n=1 Tax=Iodobacter fluviatilis TaxID=537 RepID=A0A7G3G6B6_9NEIS|nr:MOSC domain-containing protein [Iodobacter fluviatilis]QBC42734.1 MOSC domain-containing protein [Iodobacter fluviatilis]
MTIILSGLYRYPIKSSQGQRLQQSQVQSSGLPFDRTWMIATPNGRLITGREFPKLVLLSAEPSTEGLSLSAPGMPTLFVATGLFSQIHPASVWESDFTAHHGASDADAWCSAYLGEQVILLWTGLELNRQGSKGEPITFVDGHPLLLTGESSLADLNHRLDQKLSMQRFRPNLIMQGADAFAEDSWKKIRIGEVIFSFIKPCTRCVFITIDPETGEKSPNQEPLRTLAKYRKTADGVIFGQNIAVEKGGVINEGMIVEILE